jgi:hypothetical protein
LAYVEKNWISEKAYWQTTKWSVYNRKKRTNNETEGTKIDGGSGVRYIR